MRRFWLVCFLLLLVTIIIDFPMAFAEDGSAQSRAELNEDSSTEVHSAPDLVTAFSEQLDAIESLIDSQLSSTIQDREKISGMKIGEAASLFVQSILLTALLSDLAYGRMDPPGAVLAAATSAFFGGLTYYYPGRERLRLLHGPEVKRREAIVRAMSLRRKMIRLDTHGFERLEVR